MNIFYLQNDKLLNDSTSWVYQIRNQENQNTELAGYVKVKCSKYIIKDDSTFITFVFGQYENIIVSSNDLHYSDSIIVSDTVTVAIYIDDNGVCRQEVLERGLTSEQYSKSLIDTNEIQYNGESQNQYNISKRGNYTNYISGIGIVNGNYKHMYHMPCGGRPPEACDSYELYLCELIKMNDKPIDISQIKTAIFSDLQKQITRNKAANNNVRGDLLGRIQKNTKSTGVIIQRNGGNFYKKSVSISH
jgi:hypothetical protein